MSSVLAIIPARGGSVGIPKKNIKNLNGKPLIAYTIEQALKSKQINKLIVSTDDLEIAEVSMKIGAEVPFYRPKNLSKSESPSVDLVLHAINELEKMGHFFSTVCLLQPTSPYRPDGIIDVAIKQFKKSDSKSMVSIRKIPDHFHPYWSFTNKNGKLQSLTAGVTPTRRQDLPIVYHRDGAIYLVDVDFVKEFKTLLSEDLDGFEIESPELINIDNLDDWHIAEKYIGQKNNNEYE
jgi:CMP-N-acetylneuraminic acid synthetase